MLRVVNIDVSSLDVDRKFQVEYLLEYIARLEKQLDEANSANQLPHPRACNVKPSSILSREELAMLNTLF